MVDDMRDDGFEGMLRGALRSRPEAVTRADIAALALARVESREAGLERIARLRWWGRMLSVAAGLLIVVTVSAGWWLMPSDSSSSETTSVAVAGSTESSGESSTSGLGSVGLGALAVAMIGVTGVGVMSGERGVRMAA